MVHLPQDFQFSQSAMQDFSDCQQRFYLRWVKQWRYPAPQSEPMRQLEAMAEQGERFHRLAHQHQLGLPTEALLSALAEDGDDGLMAGWFRAYLNFMAQADLPVQRRAESLLSTALPGLTRRVVAKYDLLAIEPGGRAVIVDWKTAPRRPQRELMAARWQTWLYPFLLVHAGAHLYGGPIPPEQITMIYWYTATPDQPEVFTYDTAAHAACEARLRTAAESIMAREDSEAAFPLTEDERRCETCSFRSYTGRGTRAGAIGLADEEVAIAAADALDFAALEAIAF